MADTPANTVYVISKEAFASGVAYSAAVGAPNSAGVSEGFVGKLDLDSGYITPWPLVFRVRMEWPLSRPMALMTIGNSR
jgi:hypothetical protein